MDEAPVVSPIEKLPNAIPVAELTKAGDDRSAPNALLGAPQPTVQQQAIKYPTPGLNEHPAPLNTLAEVAAAPETPGDELKKWGPSEWLVQISDGQRFGPADTATMLEWVRQGRVAPDNLVHQHGWPAWKTAAIVFPELGEPNPISGTSFSSSPLLLDGRSSRSDKYRGRQAAKSRLFAIVATLGITSAALLAALIYVVRQ